MPDLPTLTIADQSQYDRVVAAFPGDTLAKKAAAYKAWLTNHLIAFVEEQEAWKIETAAQADKITKLQALRASIPPPVPFDPRG